MKKLKFLKKFLPLILFLAGLASLSSCNRGMGCPTFSAGDAVEAIVDQIPDVFIAE